MAKSSTYDPTAINLVKAGLITYRQLNEVHRLLKSTDGEGSLEDLLVAKGYLTRSQLRNRRRATRRSRSTVNLKGSLDLVKQGLITFRQLNECHRLARESKGAKSVIAILQEKGYITEVQLATLTQEEEDEAEAKKNRRFSSSWDLFRAGVVNLKALNDCHRYIQESPGKSLKEALLERGYVTAEQIESLPPEPAEKPSEKTSDGSAASGSFMERYKEELAAIPEALKEELRREHEGLHEEDEVDEALPPGLADFDGGYQEDEAGEDFEDFQGSATMLDLGHPDDAPPGGDELDFAAMQAAGTMLDMEHPGADDDDEDDDEGALGRTFMDFGDGGDEGAGEGFDAFQQAGTMLDMEHPGADDDDEDRLFDAARTFMDFGDDADEDDEEDEEDEGAMGRTFMDFGDEDAEEEEDEPEFQMAKTFMDFGGGDEDEEDGVEDGSASAMGRTFMDFGDDDFADDDEEDEDEPEFQMAKTFMDFGGGDEDEDEEEEDGGASAMGRTFMDFGDDDFADDEDDEEDEPEFQMAKTFMDFGGGDNEEDEEEEEGGAEFQMAQTFMDFGGGAEEPAVEDASASAMGRTFMDFGFDEDDEEEEEGAEFQMAKTFMDFGGGGADDEDDEEDEGGAEFQMAQTFMDFGGGGDESSFDEEDGGASAMGRTFMDFGDDDDEDDGERSAEFQMAQTFMDFGGGEDAGDGESGAPAAGLTFMDFGDGDAGEDEGEEGGAEFQMAQTFMDFGGEPAPSAPSASGMTFMDMDEEDGEPEAAAFQTAQTFLDLAGDLGIEPDASGGFAAANTFMDVGAEEGKSQTFMDALAPKPKPKKPKKPKRRDTFISAMGGESSGQTFLDIDFSAGAGTGGFLGAEGDEGAEGAEAAGVQGPGMFQSATGIGRTEPDAGGSKSGTRFMERRAKRSTWVTDTSIASASRTEAGASSGGASQTEVSGGKKKKKKRKKKKDDPYNHPLVGKVIGGCRILKKIGQGGMGAVFLAEHTRLKRESVIKVIPANLANNRQLIARFEREARAAALVQHANIVNVFNVGEEHGVNFIEMEFVDGQGIDEVLKDIGMFPQMEAARLLKDVCQGLTAAHKQGVIHRDIKPDNIMLTTKGEVKIADFGLARSSSEDMELTRAGQILGTPAYMSPEQCKGEDADARADIYSLGATFFTMITGKRPFTGETVMDIMQKHINENPISPEEINQDLSPVFAKIVVKMMAKEPGERYQSAADIIRDVEKFMREEGTEHLLELQKHFEGQFKILKKLGQGGMAAVYSARALAKGEKYNVDDTVAIKVLSSDGKDPKEVQNFKMEAEIALEIDHPNTIRVLDYKLSEAINYIVMEFVDGESIRDALRQKEKYEEAEGVNLALEALKGLDRAHELGYIHRDIKPDNIMISKAGEVKLADFGVAKRLDNEQAEETQQGDVIGTPYYMAPEQGHISEKHPMSTRADIYAMGGTLYYMLTGVRPFEGDTQMVIQLQHMEKPPVPPRELNEQISEGVNNAILNMLAKQPRYRYATVKEVVRDLEAGLAGKPVKKRKKIDRPLQSKDQGKSIAVSLAIAAVVLVALGFGFKAWTDYRDAEERDRIARIGAEMDSKFSEGAQKARSQIKALQFAEAGKEVKDSRVEVAQLDVTDAKDLWDEKSFESRFNELQKELDTARGDRDARVQKLFEQIKAAQAKSEFARGIEAAHQVATGEGDTRRAPEAEQTIKDLTGALSREGAAWLDKLEASEAFKEDLRRHNYDRALVALRAFPVKYRPFEVGPKERRRPIEPAVYERFTTRLSEVEALEKRFTDKDNPEANQLYLMRENFRKAERDSTEDPERYGENIGKYDKVITTPEFQALLASYKEARDFRSWADRARDKLIRSREEALATVLTAANKGAQAKLEGVEEADWAEKRRRFAAALSYYENRLGQENPDNVFVRYPVAEWRAVKLDEQIDINANNIRAQALRAELSRIRAASRKALANEDDPKLVTGVQLWESGEHPDHIYRYYGEDEFRSLRGLNLADTIRDDRAKAVERVKLLWTTMFNEVRDLAWKERDFLTADERLAAFLRKDELHTRVDGVDTFEQVKALRQRLAWHVDYLAMFDVQDPRLQKGLNARGEGVDNFAMVLVPAGPFTMGNKFGEGFDNATPAFEVAVTNFAIDRTEVTHEAYERFLRESARPENGGQDLAGPHRPSAFCPPDCPLTGHLPKRYASMSDMLAHKRKQQPVTHVTWHDAYAFAKWAGKELPSEKEWEKAASWDPKAGAKRLFPWGDSFTAEYVATHEKKDQFSPDKNLLPVGTKKKGRSFYGALDMAGNVWEWCADSYNRYERGRAYDPSFGKGRKVQRGGSFADFGAPYFRVTFRGDDDPTAAADNVGFRCVRRISTKVAQLAPSRGR